MHGSYARDFIGMLHEGMTQREGMMLCNGDASTRRRLLCEGTMLRQGMILRKRTMLLRKLIILREAMMQGMLLHEWMLLCKATVAEMLLR